jgi:amino-acid N-acetyltransferase
MMGRLADLRGILRYVPQYRERIFVIAMDGAIVECDNFRNLLLDIALLRSLRIGVALVHGASQQIKRLAEQTGLVPSNLDGTGITDGPTLQLALTAANRISHEILEGLSVHDLRGACGNAVVAHPAGILQGVDQQLTGRVERIDVPLLKSLLDNGIIPVLPPLGCDGEGSTFRLNSDVVAVEVARALGAVKLIYLTSAMGVMLRGQNSEVRGQGADSEEASLIRQIRVEDAEELLKKRRAELEETSVSKLASAVRATRGGVPRVHIIDGRVEEGLLAEVFSNEGIGTLVHANEYQAIRRALKKDARGIFRLIQAGVANDELLPRTAGEIERQIGSYFVFDVDGDLAACVALHQYSREKMAELACLCVVDQYENQGIGSRLMNYVETQARGAGVETLFCLSTQAVNYFTKKGGFQAGSAADLPAGRRQVYESNGRRSQVLVKKLSE